MTNGDRDQMYALQTRGLQKGVATPVSELSLVILLKIDILQSRVHILANATEYEVYTHLPEVDTER